MTKANQLAVEQVKASELAVGDEAWIHGKWQVVQRIEAGRPLFGRAWMAVGYELGMPSDEALRKVSA